MSRSMRRGRLGVGRRRYARLLDERHSLRPDPGTGADGDRLASIPYGGGGLPESVTGDTTGGFEHNAWRPVGSSAPQDDPRYRDGELLLATGRGAPGLAVEAALQRRDRELAAVLARLADRPEVLLDRRARAGPEVAAPASSARHSRFLRRQAKRFKADPGTAYICVIEKQ